MRDLRRATPLVAAALCAACALCSTAEAAVTIGPTVSPDPNSSQAVGFSTTSILFNVRSYPTIPVLAPVSGVITRWRLFTGTVTGCRPRSCACFGQRAASRTA